jgi:hydroxymethylpyrimidine pyrophosphatase-like HAD family hydrolase
MWFFRAIAMDLDGTLAVGDRVSPELLATIDDTRVDRAVLLVTGRVHSDLERVFPGLAAHFDVVVTENGAVLHTSAAARTLHDPIDRSVEKVLADRGVRTDRGEVLLAIDGSDAAVAAQVITELGLDHQVVHNRGSAMILPAGVTKASGLLAGLEELGLSPHNTIAVGDAENDLSMLHCAEVGAAVQNAVPSVADHADLVLDRPNGEGVTDLLTGPLLQGHQRFCPPRRWVPIGWFEDHEPALLPASQSSMLVTGETGSGKSYLAGLLAERWIDAGYSVLVVDPEGDHVGLAERAGVHPIDAAVNLPAPHDLLALMLPHHASLVLDLSGLGLEARLAYLTRLPEAVAAQRVRFGIPHWVIYDEAHQQAWVDGAAPIVSSVAEAGTCLVTWRPELLPADVVRTVDVTVTVSPPAGLDTEPGALRGTLVSAGEARQFRIGGRVSAHVRHWHKYAATPLPVSRRFFFHGRDPADPEAAAATVEEFSRHVRHCDLNTLDYHLTRGDFSRWVSGTLTDRDLGAELADIERDHANRHAASLERARQQVCDVIRRRYLDG